MKNLLYKKWVRATIVIVIFFLGIQFIRPEINNPPVTADIILPDSIKHILRNACYACHSNETELSWFDKIAPSNWVVASDVREGRKVLNFSEWDRLMADRQIGALFESLNHMQFNVMPLKQYTWLHPAAKITSTEINLLRSYLNTLLKVQEPDTARTGTWNKQYTKWIQGELTARNIGPSPNGIAFNPGYKNWVAISSTSRSDNGTLKIIMGNDIAVNAIKANQINPWPDGSTLAKLTWIQVVDSLGNICAGEFKQVAFMIRNRNKYSSTHGWGFAQWDMGTQLVAHGKNKFFSTGCVNCHRPMKDNDLVFTMPLHLSTERALEDKLVCSVANNKEGTMSVLYGNNIAARFARTHTGYDYPAGSALTLVTWIQKEDSNWFGANIPGVIKIIEKVSFSDSGNVTAPAVYEKFGGNLLKKIEANNLESVTERLNFILNLRASVMP